MLQKVACIYIMVIDLVNILVFIELVLKICICVFFVLLI